MLSKAHVSMYCSNVQYFIVVIMTEEWEYDNFAKLFVRKIITPATLNSNSE